MSPAALLWLALQTCWPCCVGAPFKARMLWDSDSPHGTIDVVVLVAVGQHVQNAPL